MRKILLLLFAFFTFHLVSYASNDDWLKSGNYAMATHKIDHAIFCYTQAIDNSPKDVRAYLLRSKAYQLKGEFIKSAEDKKIAFEIDPDNSRYYLETKKINTSETEVEPS